MSVIMIQYTGNCVDQLAKGWKKSVRGDKKNRYKIYKPKDCVLDEKAFSHQRNYAGEEECSTEESGDDEKQTLYRQKCSDAFLNDQLVFGLAFTPSYAEVTEISQENLLIWDEL